MKIPENEMTSYYNRVICSPTLVMPDKDQMPALFALLEKGTGQGRIDPSAVTAVTSSLEFYIRKMLSACACEISFPSHSRSYWANPQRLKSLLSRTSRKRLIFIDRSNATWSVVCQYFEPVTRDVKNYLPKGDIRGEPAYHKMLNETAWNFYLLVLATRRRSEVTLFPYEIVTSIGKLLDLPQLCSESKIRLSILQGIFSLFRKREAIPGFRCSPIAGLAFAERIDEILEDAYLLEASCLRRFFAIKSNVASIRRDLRKLLSFITKNRQWAKGILAVASHASFLPASSEQVTEKLLGILSNLPGDPTAPVLIEPSGETFGNYFMAIEACNNVTRQEERNPWCLTGPAFKSF